MREVISVHVGQCGNQVGTEFWRQLCREHALSYDGKPLPSAEASEGPECKDTFFYEGDDGRYIPRALLMDLEPRVINGIQTGELRGLYNPESIFLSTHGGGAGNNWGSGYHQAEAYSEEILEMLEREARGCDSLQGLMLTHSIAGGTGSGMGSWLLECIADAFPKIAVHTYSVFPNQGIDAASTSDVVVQPYNSLLTLKRLACEADASIVLSNDALDAIAQQQLGIKNPTVAEGNTLVSTVMAAATAALRFPGLVDVNMGHLASSLAGSPWAHLLTASYSPLVAQRAAASAAARSSNVQEVMRRLLQSKNLMVQAPVKAALQRNSRYIAATHLLQGDVSMREAAKATSRLLERRDLVFANRWPTTLQVVPIRRSPHVEARQRVSGLMIANHTAIRHTLDRTIDQFSRPFEKKAFLAEYTKWPLFQSGSGAADLSEFDDSREIVMRLSAEYRAFEEASAPTGYLECEEYDSRSSALVSHRISNASVTAS